jgi:putative oxidoreductase
MAGRARMSGLLEVLNPYDSVLLLILRIVVGAALVIHGYPKVKGARVQSGKWMESMGIPAFTADLVTVLEFVGGIFLIVGLIAPLVGLFLAVQFASIVVMKSSKLHAKFIDPTPGKPNFELDVTYLLLGLVFLFLGAGQYSLDHLLGL